MDCQGCIERCYPSDPKEFGSVNGVYPFGGRYHRPICDTCPNKDEIPPTSFEIPLPCAECPTHKQFLSLRGEMNHAINKINDHITKSIKAKKRKDEATPFK